MSSWSFKWKLSQCWLQVLKVGVILFFNFKRLLLFTCVSVCLCVYVTTCTYPRKPGDRAEHLELEI